MVGRNQEFDFGHVNLEIPVYRYQMEIPSMQLYLDI